MSDAVQIELIRAGALGVPSIVAAIFGYLGLRQSKRNFDQGQVNHDAINGRMTQMLELKGVASKAEGVQQERDRGKL